MRTTIAVDDDPSTQLLFEQALEHIARSYRRTFSADTRIRPSRLVITTDPTGAVACAASIRCNDEAFFSQQYLDAPVSELLSRRTGLAVGPVEILEVGGLACSSPFSAYPTLRALFEWGRERGISWGLFTATTEVRRLIQRARITPLMLAPADASRVLDPDQWGEYYDHDPWVCAFRDPVQMVDAAIPRAETA
ncbi:Thermostable hemolysin [Roseovarius sp. THAF27]|uniref:thermostable hemolysin n=1 Tax=Roseovarius sp. THAF27 TaxID=2587850 RepID=UPI0012680FD4|nr:thermostable hemolysin [Roseovarius sp. THAF27]QFT81963.1 Thermostable hemolysin [Roseovarius sp. THAF27]